MKRVLIFVLALTSFALQSCDEETSGENFDFSNVTAPYVEITSTADRNVVEGNTINIALRSREAYQEPITIQYEAKGGNFTQTGTATIPRNSTTVDVPIVIPVNTVAPTAGPLDITFKILGATKGGQALRLGSTPTAVNQALIKARRNLIGVSSATRTVAETGGTVTIPLTFGSKMLSATTINYTVTPIAGNTAGNLAPVTNGSLAVAADATTANIVLNVGNNMAMNPDNKYEVTITSVVPANATTNPVYVNPASTTTTVTVTDDVRTIAFAETTPTKVTTGNANFEVRLNAPSTQAVVIPYTISGATAGVDYTDVTMGTVRFEPGSTIANINIAIGAAPVANSLTITLGNPVSTDGEVMLGTKKAVTLSIK